MAIRVIRKVISFNQFKEIALSALRYLVDRGSSGVNFYEICDAIEDCEEEYVFSDIELVKIIKKLIEEGKVGIGSPYNGSCDLFKLNKFYPINKK